MAEETGTFKTCRWAFRLLGATLVKSSSLRFMCFVLPADFCRCSCSATVPHQGTSSAAAMNKLRLAVFSCVRALESRKGHLQMPSPVMIVFAAAEDFRFCSGQLTWPTSMFVLPRRLVSAVYPTCHPLFSSTFSLSPFPLPPFSSPVLLFFFSIVSRSVLPSHAF